MSNDYNQIILERFFEEALEDGLSDAEASKQAYARFWEEDIPSERVRQMRISNRLQACSPVASDGTVIVRYPYRFWDVELTCLECSGQGTLSTGHPNDPSGGSYGCHYCDHTGIEVVRFREEEYEDLENLKEDYGSRLVKASLIPGTKAP